MDQLTDSFNQNKVTLNAFVDLSKPFNTMGRIDKKLSYFDIRLNGLKGLEGFDIKWFKSYLSNRKQYMILDKSLTNKLEIKCGPHQGSILDLLLFSIHINNLAKASSFIGPIMFANDINLFHSNSSIW